jgi:hypothetical protein
MRSKTNKSVSKLVGIWTFLLLLIFKGIFPKPAYAFLSSLDACAANPECAAAISSELAPAVSAPTGAGFGASTLSTTTAAGATTSSVQGVAEISVAARLGTLGILYYWNQSQNEKAQEKAKKKYCTTYPNDFEVCTHWKIRGIAYTAPDYPDCPYAYSEQFIDVPYNVTPHLEIVQTNGYPWGCKSALLAKIPEIDYFDQITQWQSLQGLDKVEVNKSWSDWSQEKRNEAVRLLNDSDWQGLINSMPEAGVLNPGDKINAPTIVIPGEETDDPNTPADERLLRKEHGFFTFPGNPDFDKDGIPDESDSDDDNDGTPDTTDPQPYNPSVPTASGGSSNPGDSGEEVTPEVLQDIRDIVNPHENFKCVECATEIEAYLKEQGIHGERIILDTVKLVDEDSNIYDDSHPPKAEEDGYIISINGHHEGIAIKINGEEKVFDNLHPDGVPRQQWMNDLTYHSKVFGQSDFRKSGYLFP